MKITERLGALLRGLNSSPAYTGNPELRSALETARHAKFSEDYPRALNALDTALELIKDAQDSAGAVVIFLQKADVYRRQEDFAEAARALDAARARAGDEKIQQAYVISARGQLAYQQGKLDEAHADYEHALKLAREVGSPGAEGRAQGLRAQLYLKEGNASYAAHLLHEALPRLNASGDIELSPMLVGLLGQATLELGQMAEGRHLLERALKLSHQMGDRLHERRWALVLGEQALRDSRLAEARGHFERAVQLFGGQRNAEHVRTLCQLSDVLGKLRLHEDARRTAEQAVDLSDPADVETTAVARGALGVALRRGGDNSEALGHLQAAAEAIHDRRAVGIVRALALTLSDLGDAEQAMQVCKRAVQIADQYGTKLEQGLARRALGLLHSRAGSLQEAVTSWSSALPLLEADNAHAQLAMVYCDLGGVRRTLGLHQRALRDYEQALTTLNTVDSGDAETRGLVLSIAANAYAEQGDVDSADAFFNEAIALAEKLGNPGAESTRRNNYAYFLIQIGRPRRAITLLEAGLQLARAHQLTLTEAIELDNLGLAYDAVADYPTALSLHQQALMLSREVQQPYWDASIRINLAHTQRALSQFEEAEQGFREALVYGRAHDTVDLIIRALIGLGQLETHGERFDTAAAYLDEALALAKRMDQRRWLADALSARSDLYAAQEQLETARTTWEEAARVYNLLRMPQAKRIPAWMGSTQKVQPS